MNILAYLSEATCGEACWYAKQATCHCSCGGKNHGCLLTEGASTPVRTAKLDGYRYELRAVAEIDKLWRTAEAVNASVGCKDIQTSGTMRWHYTWREQDKGAPARIKLASKHQREKWKELAPFSDKPDYWQVALLWIRIDPALPQEPNYCTDDCTRCRQLRSEAHYKQQRATKGEPDEQA